MSSPNQYAIGVSTSDNFDLAAEEAISQLSDGISGSLDLLSFFCSGYSAEQAQRIAEHTQRISPVHVIGGNCVGAIGGHREFFTDEPIVVVWGASLPETQLTQFQLQYRHSIDGGAVVGWPDDSSCLDDDCVLLAIGDPYSFPMDLLLHRLNEDRPNVKVIGGMASGPAQPGDWSLIHGDELVHSGATLIAMQGNYLPEPLVSQGCRPVGEPLLITACERNEIQLLGGVPATQKLFELFDRLPTREQKLLNSGLQMGLAVSEYKEDFGYGDFLIRNVNGYDRQTGSITVGAFARVGQTVQFHVRDHETATLDLTEVCEQFSSKHGPQPQSALIFSCNGRGSNLFPEPDHDAMLLSQKLGIDSLAGFFAAGEIGPVGGKNHMHGYTASAAVFF